MRRIAIWIASTVTIVVLLFGYHTSTNRTATMNGGTVAGTGQQSSTNSSGSAGASPPDGQSSGHGAGGSSGSKKSSTSKGSSTKKSVVGNVASTQWGPVQVKIVIKHKKITAVKMIQQPSGNSRDYQINSYAVPILIHETISAQSAHIDTISGATITSGGYIQSLQSALDQAGI